MVHTKIVAEERRILDRTYYWHCFRFLNFLLNLKGTDHAWRDNSQESISKCPDPPVAALQAAGEHLGLTKRMDSET